MDDMQQPGPSDATTRSLTLPDGRVLTWTECGDPTGRPLLYCHGFPSCGREALFADAAARALGIRVLAPDRPGYAAAASQPGRRITDWPLEALAILDALAVTRAPVLGVSGGAPYALACAAHAPGRFGPVATAGGLGPLTTNADAHGMSALSRLSIRLARRGSPLLAGLFHLLAAVIRRQPRLMFALLAGSAPPRDRDVFRDRELRGTWQAALQAAVCNGAAGAIGELRLYTRPWGFDLDRVTVPVDVWHGGLDTVVPPAHGQRLAAALPNATYRGCPDDGHFSLPIRWIDGILERLIDGE